MRGEMDELVGRFHSLQGNNLQETKRNFNELIDVIRRDVPLETDLNILISSIQPKTKLERILKVEMLIRFERCDALLEILKGGNPMLIGKVLKCWKLFPEVFSSIDSQALVGQIFSEMSFSTRTKIITRFSTNLKNEELADEYFHAIEDKYGMSAAKGMLPACSLGLIKSTVATYKLTLTSRQLLKIVKRNPAFLSYYLDVMRPVTSNFDFPGMYPLVFKYLAKVDPQQFWVFFRKYRLSLKFGRHMTSRMYESGKEVVTPSHYDIKLFNLRQLYKIVGKNEDDLRRFILQVFPKKGIHLFPLEYSYRCLQNLIGYVPKNKRYVILNGCFEEVYGKSIHELLSVDTPEDIMEFMPVQEREIILDKKVPSEENFIYLYSPKKAIPLLQERIKLTSNLRKRRDLLVQLNKTCMLSRDSEALLEVLKYVRSRHRNDSAVLSDFLISLQEWPKLEKLTGEHWSYINELLHICKRMTVYRLHFYDINFMLKYLIYLVENGLSCEEFMESFMLHLKETTGSFEVFYNLKLPKWEKMCNEYFARLLPKLYADKEFETCGCMLLAAIVNYNNQNPKNRIIISEYPHLIEMVKSQITKESYFNSENVFLYYLKFEDEVLGDQMFWDNYKKFCNADMIMWYLQKRPNKIFEHLDKILTPQIIQRLGSKLNEILNLVSFLPSISEKIVDFSLKALHDDDAAVSKFAAISLSYLATKEQYFEAVRPFLPLSQGKIENIKENFVVTHAAILDGLANLDGPASCLPILSESCYGDYMKYAMKSLYRVVSHTPESKLELFLNSLYNSAVSVRKQAVNLATRFSPKSTVHNFLKCCSQNDKYPPLRSVIFETTLRYLNANPSEEFWNLVKDKIQSVKENDKKTLTCLVKVRKIPVKYLSEYFPIVYTILSNVKEKEIQAKKYILLTSLYNELVDELNVRTLTTVIKDTFPIDVRKTDFYLRCLFYTTGSKNALVMELIFDILKDYVEKSYTINKARTDLFLIIYCICARAIVLKFGKSVIEKFIEFWTSNVKQGKLQEEYLHLRLTDTHLGFYSDDNPGKFGVKVSELLGEWVELHGSSCVVPIFIERLYDFLLCNGRKDFEFVYGLLHASDTDFNYVVALNLLFNRVCYNAIKVKYGSVLTEIREHKSSAVQIHLNYRLRENKD